MKKFLVYLFVVALLQSVFVFAQDDRRHGGGEGRSGGNANPAGGERIGNSGDNVDKPQAKDDSKAQKQRKGGDPQPLKQRGLGNGRSKGNSQWPGNNQILNPKRNLNPQNQFPNRQGNQGVGGNSKRNGDNFGNSPRVGGGNNGQLHNRQGGNGQGGSLNRSQSSAVPPRFQKMGIRSLPQPIQNRGQILATSRQHSTITPPGSGPRGAVLHASVIAPRAMTSNIVQTHMGRITSNAAFSAQVNLYNRNEVRANNYYWHTWNGNNYCHYYDSWGYHWYGWYIGSSYFWTRYYSNNWWWYDSGYDRWCYWHDGGWWWQDPARVNVVYVYNNGEYAPVNYNQTSNNDSNLVVYQSNDGTRKVKVMGDNRDAFLYDTSNSSSFDPVFLGSGIRDVKFSDSNNGNPLQVILTLSNGSFEMFDAYGNRYNSGNNE